MTVLRAGPGFGKSTLLWQAISENSLVPLGEDRFWRCTTEDASSDGLAAALALMVGLDPPRLSPADTARKVVGIRRAARQGHHGRRPRLAGVG